MDYTEWNRRLDSGKAATEYLQAWSMVHCLLHGHASYRQAFEKYLHGIAGGAEPGRAYDESFGAGSVDLFERRWKEYVGLMKPDLEATAAYRMEFLSIGLLGMHLAGVKPRSFEEFQRVFQQTHYRQRRRGGHGAAIEIRADDSENFRALGSDGREVPIELVPSGDGRMPAGLLVRGLRVPVRLKWEAGPGGSPVAQIVYE